MKKRTANKNFKSNLNELKRLTQNEFGNLLPDYCDEYGSRKNSS